MSIFTFKADETQSGERLDKITAILLPQISRTAIQSLVKEGVITVNNSPVKSSYRLEEGDQISIIMPESEAIEVAAEDIALDVIYDDKDLAAINKAAGMVVHPAAGHSSGTLVNAILHRWPALQKLEEKERAGIVHRLDKDTSGVILIAKTEKSLANLQRQFKERTTEKIYIALVDGHPESYSGMIDAPIGRDTKQRKKMAVVRNGKPAQTRYEVIESFPEHSLMKLALLTGRTHQIRVHLAWLGYPVVGDSVYGHRKKTLPVKRFFLHATELAVDSPSTGKRLVFQTPLPPDLQYILDQLRKKR